VGLVQPPLTARRPSRPAAAGHCGIVFASQAGHAGRRMKTYLTYGLAMTVAGALLTLALFFLDFHSDPAKLRTAQWIGMGGGLVIGIAAIVLGTKARRAELPATEEFGYGRALGTGVMIVLFAALFGIVTNLLYTQVINPNFSEVLVQAQIEKWEAAGMSADKIEKAEGLMRKMMNPAIQACVGFLSGMVFGTLISLVTAAFLKREASAEPPVVA
jgi:hypothetical protein